jgi:hypothetical protein
MIATTEKKIAVRKAPTEKANTYEEGFTTIGSDGVEFVVKIDKNGIKRWMKVKKENAEPKRASSKKEQETFYEAPEKIKRAYKKKTVMVEQGTQTDVPETPKKAPATPKKAPATPKKA